jgi:uncharacterized protein (TIGR03000 family)
MQWLILATVLGTQTPPPPGEDGNLVYLRVRVPADAEVWVEGQKTQQTGTDRLFYSPPIVPGKTYVYEVRARWMVDGRVVDRARKVRVRAGQESAIDFLRPMSAPAPREQNRIEPADQGVPPDREPRNQAIPRDRSDLPPATSPPIPDFPDFRRTKPPPSNRPAPEKKTPGEANPPPER